MKRQVPEPGEHHSPTYWDEEGVERRKYVLRYWVQWHADTAFWPANAARERFGIGSIEPERKPLTPETRQTVHAIADWHAMRRQVQPTYESASTRSDLQC